MKRWKDVVRRSLSHTPPRTRPGWNLAEWSELAEAFAPETARAREKRLLRDFLLASDDRQLGALADLWRLQANYPDEEAQEEKLHADLERRAPVYGALVQAICAYEAFARRLQDAFDVLRAEAAAPDARGFVVPDVVRKRGLPGERQSARRTIRNRTSSAE